LTCLQSARVEAPPSAPATPDRIGSLTTSSRPNISQREVNRNDDVRFAIHDGLVAALLLEQIARSGNVAEKRRLQRRPSGPRKR
jgi:hypothetical protein